MAHRDYTIDEHVAVLRGGTSVTAGAYRDLDTDITHVNYSEVIKDDDRDLDASAIEAAYRLPKGSVTIEPSDVSVLLTLTITVAVELTGDNIERQVDELVEKIIAASAQNWATE